jgi:hypothetical protein
MSAIEDDTLAVIFILWNVTVMLCCQNTAKIILIKFELEHDLTH